MQRGIYRSARHAGITAHSVVTSCTGCKAKLGATHGRRCREPGWIVEFQFTSKSAGRAAIVAQVKAGRPLAYNLRR